MNIHEYQAKQLLKDYGVPVPAGQPAQSPEEIESVLEGLPANQPVVVKAHPPYKGSSEGQSLDTCNYSSSSIARSSISSAQLTQKANVGLSENI